MLTDTFYILAPPAALPRLGPWDVLPVCPAYRFGAGAGLLRLRGAESLRGGLMLITGRGDEPFSPETVYRQIRQACAARSFRGVMLNVRHPSADLRRLIRLLEGAGFPLFLPEVCARDCSTAFVLISSALSGGTLSQRLAEAVENFGAERIVLAAERCAVDFPLPAPDGQGSHLTDEALHDLMDRHRPQVHFSPALCAHCFLYPATPYTPRFVLFDDPQTLQKKLAIARRAGIRRFFMAWEDICQNPSHFHILARHTGVNL